MATTQQYTPSEGWRQFASPTSSHDLPSPDPGNDNKVFGIATEGPVDCRPTQWDQFVLSGTTLPGVAIVEGERDSRIDMKCTQGTDGGNAAHLGLMNATINVRLRLWTQEQLNQLRKMLPTILATIGKSRPDPVSVYHPALALLGIRALFLKSIGVPRVNNPGGPVEVTFRFIEFLPPEKVPKNKDRGPTYFRTKPVPRAGKQTPTRPKPSSSGATP